MFDSDSRHARRMFGLGVGLIILFIVSWVQSCSELKYTLSGETTMANVSRCYETTSASRRGGKVMRVVYHFDDADGKRHKGEDSVPLKKWIEPADKQVEIIYRAGTPEINKLTANRSWVFPIIFLSMLGLIAGWIVWISIQAKRGVYG
jgi:hypothetical protein